MPHVVEHDHGRDSVLQILSRNDLLTGHIDLHVPAQGVHTFRQRLDHIERRYGFVAVCAAVQGEADGEFRLEPRRLTRYP